MSEAAFELVEGSTATFARPLNFAADVDPESNLAADLLAHPALMRLQVPEAAQEMAPVWSCAELAGRLCELSAGRATAALSVAFGLILEAQRAGEPVAWVSATASTFYPPDAAAGGVDLAALVVVRAKGAHSAGRAADVLLRSGAYGLVVLDLPMGAGLPNALQGRLVQLALKHDATVLCLTEKEPDKDSLGSLISLRGQARRRRVENGFVCHVNVLKDKRRGPGWRQEDTCCGPDGLH